MRLRSGIAKPSEYLELDHSAVLVEYAGRHGVLPVLHRAVELDMVGCASIQIRAGCWAAYEATRDRNARAETALEAVSDCLADEGIRLVAHKGPALTHYLYADSALRQYSDLDILLKQSELFRASEAIGPLGYESKTKITQSSREDFLNASRQYDLEMIHTERGELLELHWRTDAQHFVERLDESAWWETLQSVEISGRLYRQLRDRELLFALLIHGTKHRWSRMAWLLDIALLVPKLDTEDFEWLRAVAEHKKCFVRLQIGLLLADSIFLTGKRLDPRGENSSMQRRVQRIVTCIANEILRTEAPEPPGLWRSIRADLQCNDTATQSVRKIARLIFTPNHDDWHDLPAHPLAKLSAFASRVGRLVTRQRHSP